MSILPVWLEQKNEEEDFPLPGWALDFRKQQWSAFTKTGLPTRKDERFKYTDLSFLANQTFSPATRVEDIHLTDIIKQYRLHNDESMMLVFVNGYFMPTLSDQDKLPDGVIACTIHEAMHKHEALIKTHWLASKAASQYPFAELNAAKSVDGLFLYVPKGCHLVSPIHLLSLVVNQEAFVAHPRHLFILDDDSQLTLIEEYVSLVPKAYMMNVVTQVVAKKKSRYQHCKIQHEGRQAVHMAHLFIHQHEDSSVNSTSFATGSRFARDEVIVTLTEPGADCRTGGFYRLNHDNQYIDYHIDIDHAAPRSNSEMLYKGILNNKSCAVFNGHLKVESGAQKIVAYQANHNLLLSKDAEVYSKPELEIYADDVKCKHGASTGQIDQDAIFYLRSRGIPREEAMNMLLQGFADEIFQRVTHVGMRKHVEERVR